MAGLCLCLRTEVHDGFGRSSPSTAKACRGCSADSTRKTVAAHHPSSLLPGQTKSAELSPFHHHHARYRVCLGFPLCRLMSILSLHAQRVPVPRGRKQGSSFAFLPALSKLPSISTAPSPRHGATAQHPQRQISEIAVWSFPLALPK